MKILASSYKLKSSGKLSFVQSSVPKNLRLLADKHQSPSLPNISITNVTQSFVASQPHFEDVKNKEESIILKELKIPKYKTVQNFPRLSSRIMPRRQSRTGRRFSAMPPENDNNDLDPEIIYLLLNDLKIATEFYDLSPQNLEANAYNISEKKQALKDLIHHLTPSSFDYWLNPLVSENLDQMFLQNLSFHFKVDPVIIAQLDENTSFPNPQWEHVNLVYAILIRYLRFFRSSAYLSPQVLNAIIKHAASPDAKERINIFSILSQYVESFPNSTEDVLKKLFYLICQYLDDKTNYFCVTSTLHFFSKYLPVIERSSKFNFEEFVVTIVSLVSTPQYHLYSENYSQCLKNICKKFPRMMKVVISKLVQRFPFTEINHQVPILKLINEILYFIPKSQFAAIYKPLFKLNAKCLLSYSQKVCEAAFQIWDIKQIHPYISSLASDIYPLVYKQVLLAMNGPNQTSLRGQGLNILSTMSKLNQKEYSVLTQKCKQKSQINEYRKASWEMIVNSTGIRDTQQFLASIPTAEN